MTIDFSQAIDSFSSVFHDVNAAKTRFVVVFGGAASGKSYAVHQLEVLRILEEKDGNTMIMRKYGTDIRDSSYGLLSNIINDWDLRDYFDFRFSNDMRFIRVKSSGRSIIFKGLDDTEKLKSIVGIKRIIVEEASQITFEDFKELNRRARGMDDIQIIFILNPISENHWIKSNFCDPTGAYYPDTTVLKYTYKDNPFLTDVDIKELERLKDVDENQYRIYTLGEWGLENKEGKFCWAFTQAQVKKPILEPERVHWATFDFNVNPLTCTVAQVFPGIQTIRALECFQLANSDIWQMCERLKAAYPDVIWKVTGDASGKNRQAISRDNLNYYHIIKAQLGLTMDQLVVPSSNPGIEENKILVNAMHKNWTVEIDPDKCKPLIYDLTYVEVGGDGRIIKGENRNGSNTDSNKKKYADFLDNWRYLINVAVGPHIRIGVNKITLLNSP